MKTEITEFFPFHLLSLHAEENKTQSKLQIYASEILMRIENVNGAKAIARGNLIFFTVCRPVAHAVMTGTYCVIGSYFSRNYGYAVARFFEIEPAAYRLSLRRRTVLKAISVNRDYYRRNTRGIIL